MTVTMLAPASQRLANAREIIANTRGNDWMGGDDAVTIARARYAVAIERDNDGWVLACADVQELAHISLGCMTGTEGYDEWIEGVYDVATGEAVAWSGHTIEVARLDGARATSTTQHSSTIVDVAVPVGILERAARYADEAGDEMTGCVEHEPAFALARALYAAARGEPVDWSRLP